MSDGRLVVEPYVGGSIYPKTEELYGVDAGVLEVGMTSPQYVVDKFPQANLFANMAGGLTAVQTVMWHLRGGGDELAARMYEPLNVHYVGLAAVAPPEIWCHSNVEINSVDDIDGLKMRTAGAGGEIISRMGGATVFTPFDEIYESLQRGVIDACDASNATTNWKIGLQEVSDFIYLSPTRAPTDNDHLWVNRDAWEELSPGLQMMVTEAVRAVGWEFYIETVMQESDYLQKFIDYGVQVQELPDVVEDAFIAEANEFYDEKSAADPFYAEIVASVRAFKELCELSNIR